MYVMRSLLLLLCSVTFAVALAQESGDVPPSPVTESDTVTAKPDGGGVIGWLKRYVSGDPSDTLRRSRFSFFPAPHYDSQIKFGVALVGTGTFHLPGRSLNEQPSNTMIFFDVTTAGYITAMFEGNFLFHDDIMRINYEVGWMYSPADFWGMTYDVARHDANKTQLTSRTAYVMSDVLFRLADNFYVGPAVAWNYAHAAEVGNPELLEGQHRTVRNYGAGFTVDYDTRDLITNASRGVFLHLKQLFQPSFLANDYSFSTTDFKVNFYRRVWRGGVLAAQVHALFNFGSPSWAMMAKVGNTVEMRGYYRGRYRDNHAMTTQVELRQRIYKKIGAVVWLGGGAVFHDSKSLNHFLPNAGVGLRWELRKNTNVRADFGVARAGDTAIMFGINEAF